METLDYKLQQALMFWARKLQKCISYAQVFHLSSVKNVTQVCVGMNKWKLQRTKKKKNLL